MFFDLFDPEIHPPKTGVKVTPPADPPKMGSKTGSETPIFDPPKPLFLTPPGTPKKGYEIGSRVYPRRPRYPIDCLQLVAAE